MRKELVWAVALLGVVGVEFPAQKKLEIGEQTPPTLRDIRVKTDAHYGRMPLSFIPNDGQINSRVSFYVQGRDKTLYFTPEGITFALVRAPQGPDDLRAFSSSRSQFRALRDDFLRPGFLPYKRQLGEDGAGIAESGSPRWAVKLDFVGSDPGARPVGEARTEAVVSYFKGKRDDWHAGLPTYSKIVYHDLWPGIDLAYSGTFDRLKYEFIIHPGADPELIRMKYSGVTGLDVNELGQLELNTPGGGFRDGGVVAFQEKDGRHIPVKASYEPLYPRSENHSEELKNPSPGSGSYSYGFKFGDYDESRALILDPEILVYCGYIGGSGSDWGYGIAVDAFENTYITGATYSSEASFPAKAGPDLTYNGSTDAFVAKVNVSGTGLVYCGFIGGSKNEYGSAIAVDGAGNAYISGATGSSEATFPVTTGPDLTYNGGDGDAFLAKLDALGTGLVYCGYIGGYSGDWSLDAAGGVAVDDEGNAYVAGYTESTEATFPVNIGPDLTYNGGYDAFIAKVNASGTALAYCGYIGGSGNDISSGIAVDGLGNAFLTGDTESTETTFPVTVGPDLTYNGFISDAFVAKVNASGSALAYCGYIGGLKYDEGKSIALDPMGNAYVAGYTDSTESSFPVTVGPDQTYNGGNSDIFIAKVDSTGTGLVYCGFIGGSGSERGFGIAIDGRGNALVTGETDSTEASFPVTIGPDLTFNGAQDAFVARVNASGASLDCCGYIGGSGRDTGRGIVADNLGNFYVAGYTDSAEETFPVIVGPDLTFNGTEASSADDCDVFVAKLSAISEPAPVINLSRTSINYGSLGMNMTTKPQFFSISNSGGGTLNWTMTPNQSWITVQPASGAGTAQIEVRINPSGLPAGTNSGTILAAAPGASNSPQAIQITLKVYENGTTSPPFGYFETPLQGTSGVEGSIPVTGWALDDIEVTKVDIWRDPVSGEAAHPNGYVYIGDAVFVKDARPDVEASYPAFPFNDRAGWGYMMLTNLLPNQGNGTFHIHAFAYDIEGQRRALGEKTITCDNAHAALPFGAIDTPAQGGTVSGSSYVIFGWALTPQPKAIPIDGSTIWLWIDGQPIGHPTYNNYRSDIANLFPGFANTDGAVGYFHMDTTKCAGGVHTIAWSVQDSAGKISGIGSRYFSVMNAEFAIARDPNFAFVTSRTEDGYEPGPKIHDIARIPADTKSPVHIRQGYDREIPATPIYPDENGVVNIEIPEVERIEIMLAREAGGAQGFNKTGDAPCRRYAGRLVFGTESRPLPAGSMLDSGRGIFSWQPGPGFIGDYEFEFIEILAGQETRQRVRITVRPIGSLRSPADYSVRGGPSLRLET